jgi:hypothetical protein
MRTVNGQNEEIQSYDHNIGYYVRVLIGTGNMVDGAFVFTFPQQFQTYIIADAPANIQSMTDIVLRPAITDYSDLISATGGAITTDSLWTSIDAIRARE